MTYFKTQSLFEVGKPWSIVKLHANFQKFFCYDSLSRVVLNWGSHITLLRVQWRLMHCATRQFTVKFSTSEKYAIGCNAFYIRKVIPFTTKSLGLLQWAVLYSLNNQTNIECGMHSLNWANLALFWIIWKSLCFHAQQWQHKPLRILI